MTVRSLHKVRRELLYSRSVAASAIRVCAMVVLVQSALFVMRAPFASRGASDFLVMEINTDDTARYRNGSYVNGKALVSLLAELMQTLGERVKLNDEAVQGPERFANLMRLSDDQFWAVKKTLEKVLPEADIIAPDAAPSERPGAAPLPLPARYLAELHKVVLFDQWLKADELTVWLSPLSDDHEMLQRFGMKDPMMSICVSHRGQPQLAAVYTGGQVHWGMYGRGNDLQLAVKKPMKPFPKRFSITADSPQAKELAKRAFYDDAKLSPSSNIVRSMLLALAKSADAVLLAEPTPLRTVCAGHTFLRLYAGKVTDLTGKEVKYPRAGGNTEGTVLAALFYHNKMLQQVVSAMAGKNITRQD